MSTKPLEVLVIGFGAVGTIYGYILTQAGCNVTAIARSSYATMHDKGIDIRSEKFGQIPAWRPYRLVQHAAEANDRVYDFIICTFKALPDLLPTPSVLSDFLEGDFKGPPGQGPTVVLIQNGIGIETELQSEYPLTPIISVVAWIGVNLLPNAVVVHGILEKLIIGLYIGEGHGLPSQLIDPAGYFSDEDGAARRSVGLGKTAKFAEQLKKGGGEVQVTDDIQSARFQKNLWNASLSTLCTLSRCTVSDLVTPAMLPYTLPVVRRTMLEIIYVARAWGIDEKALPAASIDNAIKITIANYQVNGTSGSETPSTPFPRSDPFSTPEDTTNASTFKPSMLLDVEAGRPCELEVIVGSILDRARAKAVETPRLDLIYASLKAYQIAAVEHAGNSPAHQEHIRNWRSKKPAIAGGGTNTRWETSQRHDVKSNSAHVAMAGGKLKVTGKPVLLDDSVLMA